MLGYNCTAFARELLQLAGLKFPGRKVVPFAYPVRETSEQDEDDDHGMISL